MNPPFDCTDIMRPVVECFNSSGPLPPQRLRLAPRVLLARPVTHPEISLTPCKHALRAINSPWQSGLAWYSQLGKSVAGFTPDRKSKRLNSSHANISYAVFCLQKK